MSFEVPATLDEHVAEYLTEQIVNGQLAPGQKISETGLARELGVSKGPVREALLKLESKGLVELAPRRSPRVTEMTPSEVGWLFDIIGKLSELAASSAAQNRTKKDLAQMRLTVKKVRDCAARADVVGFNNALFEFSFAGLQAAKNPLLERMFRDMEASARRVEIASFAQRKRNLRSILGFIEDAVRYVEAGDAEMASQTVRAYVEAEKAQALGIPKKGRAK
jgi:DNA-binding GntR family transcriptional regulator